MKRVIFPDALDARVMAAATQLVEQGIAAPILVANPFECRHLCQAQGIKLPPVRFIDPLRQTLRADFIERLQIKLPKASRDELEARMDEPLWVAAMCLDQGLADTCIAGNLSSTANVLRAGIRVLGMAKDTQTVSSIMFMLPPNTILASDQPILAFADCGVIPEPTVSQLADITIQTAKNFEQVMQRPARVAMLSFSSHGSAKHPAAEKVQQAVTEVKIREPELCIDGELQFDAAFVPQVAAQKVPESVLQGQANVFVFPSLEAANIGYKIAQRLGGFKAVGPLIQGLRLPLHDLSRGCSSEDIVEVTKVALSMM